MIEDELIDLVKKAFKGEKNTTLPNKELFKITCEQNLSAYLYLVYNNDFFKKFYLASTLQNTLYDEEATKISELFRENQIHHVFIKGYVLKKLYKTCAMRVMGDVDILVFKEDFAKASSLMESLNYKEEHENKNHRSYLKGKIQIELHHKLVDEDDTNLGITFNDYKSYLVEIKPYAFELTDTYHLFYLLIHYIKHLREGTGIRPILDLYLLYTKGTIDNQWLLKKIKEWKLERFWQVVLSEFNLIFKLPYDNNDEKTARELFKFSIESGMNGASPNHSSVINRLSYRRESKFKFLLKKLFPSYLELSYSYPFIQHKILVPLAYFLNIFRLIFKKSKVAIKVIKYNNENNIYKKVGL